MASISLNEASQPTAPSMLSAISSSPIQSGTPSSQSGGPDVTYQFAELVQQPHGSTVWKTSSKESQKVCCCFGDFQMCDFCCFDRFYKRAFCR
jgi:hypothetical protein